VWHAFKTKVAGREIISGVPSYFERGAFFFEGVTAIFFKNICLRRSSSRVAKNSIHMKVPWYDSHPTHIFFVSGLETLFLNGFLLGKNRP
jgi:hypothetical protein